MPGPGNVIGVACNDGEKYLAREFFELFKTPWEFYRPEHTYPVVVSTLPRLTGVRANLLVIYSSAPDDGVTEGASDAQDTYLEYREAALPLYGKVRTFESGGATLLRLRGSSAAAAIATHRPPVTVLRAGYDLFQEVGLLLSSGQPGRNALLPTLDIHISMLRDWMAEAGIPFVEVPAVPPGRRFMVCLTHDVDFLRIRDHKLDHTMWGFVGRASVGSLWRLMKRDIPWRRCLDNWKAALMLPGVHLGLCKDFWFEDFGRYADLERDLKATFFFIPFKNRPGQKVRGRHAERRAAAYDVTEQSELVQNLTEMGHEAGVHGIDAWHDADKGREEHRRLAETSGKSRLGVRMHWLCFDASSPRILEEAGFEYDSTSGYNDAVGYRAGTSQVFQPIGARRLLELPMHIQDTALFYSGRLGLSESQAWERCELLINNAAAYGGVLTILWHTRSLAPERFWGGFYVRLLDALRTERAWFATALQITDWFRHRRALAFRQVDFSGGRLRLVLDYQPPEYGKPNLTLRIHNAARGFSAASRGARTFLDIPWTGDRVMEIPIAGD